MTPAGRSGVSRTLRHPLHEVWDLRVSPEGVALWLGRGVSVPEGCGAEYETDDSTVQMAVVAGGPARTTLRFHQERLASADERERQRSHRAGVLDAVAAELDDGG